jgi:hypothetical protein
MSGKLSSLSRRLAKVEQQAADQARRAELANCACTDLTIANPDLPEEFEAEMNLPCPAHGFRRLGRIMRIRFLNPDDRTAVPSPRLDELIATYEARLAQADREQAHDPQES